jgi:hypothetical protein
MDLATSRPSVPGTAARYGTASMTARSPGRSSVRTIRLTLHKQSSARLNRGSQSRKAKQPRISISPESFLSGSSRYTHHSGSRRRTSPGISPVTGVCHNPAIRDDRNGKRLYPCAMRKARPGSSGQKPAQWKTTAGLQPRYSAPHTRRAGSTSPAKPESALFLAGRVRHLPCAKLAGSECHSDGGEKWGGSLWP